MADDNWLCEENEVIKPLMRQRFEALAGYARDPNIVLIVQELEWHATNDERLLGMVTLDRIDNDFGWVIFGRDERLRFRAIDVNASLSTVEVAREELFSRLAAHYKQPDEDFHQGDTKGAPMDFLTPRVAENRLNSFFRILIESRKYSPARGLIEPMMRFYEDADGNFVEQFQTTAFDARLWELYLFATFIELGYAPLPETAVPDFVLRSPFGSLGVEATTCNPPNNRAVTLPENKEQYGAYLENYIPIKLGRVLRRKLEKKTPYWKIPELADLPFVIAVQDFHSPGSMRMITHAATEYVFGVRHSIREGKHVVERIDEHVWGGAREISGFSLCPTPNISALS